MMDTLVIGFALYGLATCVVDIKHVTVNRNVFLEGKIYQYDGVYYKCKPDSIVNGKFKEYQESLENDNTNI